MRILAFSDLHRNRDIAQAIVDASGETDVVIGAGDFATKGIGLHETIGLLRALTVPTLLAAGNHDRLDELRDACRDSKAIHILHGDGVVIDGVSFFGLGFEVPARRDEPWNQGLDEPEAARLLQACPCGAVLVTHSPPFGIADIQTTGVHEGSRSIRDTIASSKARLHLCGHIHHAWGTSGVIGECPVHNLGPSVNWFTIQ